MACTTPGAPTDANSVLPQLVGTCRVGAIGDSITLRFDATTSLQAYRGVFYTATWPPPAGLSVAFTQEGVVHGAAFNNDRSFSYAGQKISDFLSGGDHDVAEMMDPLTSAVPGCHIYSTMLGTNDAVLGVTYAGVFADYLELLEYEYSFRPDSRYLYLIPPPKVSDVSNAFVETVVQAELDAIADFVSDKPDLKYLIGNVFADAGLIRTIGVDYENDGHPNNSGHAKIGNNIYIPKMRSLSGNTVS